MSKKNIEKNDSYSIDTENLAIPEIHTGKVGHETDDNDKDSKKEITYDTVAVPEVHIRKKDNNK